MLGGLESIIGIIILLVVVAFMGPKAYLRIRKAMTYGRLLDIYAKRKLQELEKKVEEGKISEEELIKEIEKAFE